jgi:hypothetical protein
VFLAQLNAVAHLAQSQRRCPPQFAKCHRCSQRTTVL